MPPDRASFHALNLHPSAVPEYMGSFTLAAPPNTDLWRKPLNGDISTAPILYTLLRHPFIAAEVTVSADWELEWDQGGLVIFAGAPPGRAVAATTPSSIPSTSIPTAVTATAQPEPTAPNPQVPASESDEGLPPPYSSLPGSSPYPPPRWLKVGLEFSSNACHATSVYANGDGADWALSALPPRRQQCYDLRVKLERIGHALWVWYEEDDFSDGSSGGGGALGPRWKKLREVTGFFFGVEDKAVRVGVYASRPANIGGTMWDYRAGRRGSRTAGGGGASQRNLCVDFEGLEVW